MYTLCTFVHMHCVFVIKYLQHNMHLYVSGLCVFWSPYEVIKWFWWRVSVCLVVVWCLLCASCVLCLTPKLFCVHVHLLSLNKAVLTFTLFYTFSVVLMITVKEIFPLKMLTRDCIDKVKLSDQLYYRICFFYSLWKHWIESRWSPSLSVLDNSITQTCCVFPLNTFSTKAPVHAGFIPWPSSQLQLLFPYSVSRAVLSFWQFISLSVYLCPRLCVCLSGLLSACVYVWTSALSVFPPL